MLETTSSTSTVWGDPSLPLAGRKTPSDLEGRFEREAVPQMQALDAGAYRLVRNAADAEDLVQGTYLRAFRAFHLYTPGTNIRAWLFTILYSGPRRPLPQARPLAPDRGARPRGPRGGAVPGPARRRSGGGAARPRAAPGELPRRRGAARHAGLQLRGDRRNPADPHRHGDVAHPSRPLAAARNAAGGAGGAGVKRTLQSARNLLTPHGPENYPGRWW